MGKKKKGNNIEMLKIGQTRDIKKLKKTFVKKVVFLIYVTTLMMRIVKVDLKDLQDYLIKMDNKNLI